MWRDRAACSKINFEVFFDPAKEFLAKMICTTCAVRTECSDEATLGEYEEGIWGGFSPVERTPTIVFVSQAP